MIEKSLTDAIISAFFAVYHEHGYGFLESVYANSLVIELGLRGLKVRREVTTEVVYRGVTVGFYRIDMIVEERVLIEIKSSKAIADADLRQLMNYLKATNTEIGLLLHFGPSPQVKRRIYTNDRK